MKSKHTFTPPPKFFLSITLAVSTLLSVGCSAEAISHSEQQPVEIKKSASSEGFSETASEVLTDLTSGNLYQNVMQIDPDILLQESGASLHITRDVSSGEAKGNIRRFFWDIVQISELSGVWDTYTNLSCTFIYGDDMANVGISDYNSILDFSTTHINIIQDKETAALFDVFYNAVYGARDVSIVQEKQLYDLSLQTGTSGYSLPKDYRAGYLWVYSSFGNSCGYSVQDNSISVQVIADDSEAGGKEAAQELTAAVDLYNKFYNDDSLAMPYTKILIQYQTASGSAKLWDWCSEKTDGSWSVILNKSYSTNFANGIKSTTN